MPKFDLPNMEMPEAFREMAEKGVEQTRDAYAKAKVASEEAADLLQNTYEAAAQSPSLFIPWRSRATSAAPNAVKQGDC
jgi:hypothetical protein